MKEQISIHLKWILDGEMDINDTELLHFSIKYYLKFYDKINKAMKRILIKQIIGTK